MRRPLTPVRRMRRTLAQAFWWLTGVVDRQLHGGDLLGFFVGDLDAELVFQRHHQFDRVERVGPEVGDEGLLVRDVRLGHAELLGNDLLDSRFDIVLVDVEHAIEVDDRRNRRLAHTDGADGVRFDQDDSPPAVVEKSGECRRGHPAGRAAADNHHPANFGIATATSAAGGPIHPQPLRFFRFTP